jgi:hypothetical protein
MKGMSRRDYVAVDSTEISMFLFCSVRGLQMGQKENGF